MKKITKAVSLLLVFSLTAVSAVSCGDSKNSDNSGNMVGNIDSGNIKEEDMPFGSTYTKINADSNSEVPISIEYDHRFMTEEDAVAISKYMAAVNDRDGDAIKSVVYPAFLDYMIEYSGATNAKKFAETRYDNYKTIIGEDFSFDYIIVNDMATEADYDFSLYDQIILEGTTDAVISDKKMFYLECTYKTANGSGDYSNVASGDILLCLYTIDGTVYVLS